MSVWSDYLRADRARKLMSIEMLAAREYTISRTVNGEARDLNDVIADGHRRDIAQIEAILAEAGEPLEASE